MTYVHFLDKPKIAPLPFRPPDQFDFDDHATGVFFGQEGVDAAQQQATVVLLVLGSIDTMIGPLQVRI